MRSANDAARLIRRLEGRASGYDPELGIEVFCLLRAIRGYETRVRQLVLKSDSPRCCPLTVLKPPGYLGTIQPHYGHQRPPYEFV